MSMESDGWSSSFYDDDSHHLHNLQLQAIAKAKREADEAALQRQFFDGLELATASTADIDEKLKARMYGLYELLAQLADDGKESSAAKDKLSLAEGTYNAYPTPNASQSATAMRECIDVNIELCEKLFTAQTASQIIEVELGRQTLAVRSALSLLREACTNIESNCPEHAKVRYIAAARHFADEVANSPHLVRSIIGQNDVRCDPDRDPNEWSVGALIDIMHKAATHSVEADRLAQKLGALGPTLTKVEGANDVLEPVRPTEEEVQRYMMQLEQRMRQRMAAHIEVKPLLEQRQDLVDRLTQLETAIDFNIGKIPSGKHSAKLAAVVTICSSVAEELNRVIRRLRNSNFWDKKKADSLKTTSQPTATAYDTTTIPLIKEVIKAHAFSLGRRNEARASERATVVQAKAIATVDGIVSCKSVKQALAWQAQHEAEVLAAAKKNYSREVKLELLVESVRAFSEEVSASETSVHRQTVSLLPGRGVVPCDELRALFNAASWLYEGNDSYDEARYPIF
jgi:hypothetical protein